MTAAIPGTLGLAEQAILASTIPWALERIDCELWRLTDGHERYRITSEGDNPRYWTARELGVAKDLAAGAGELGLVKCIRACERHAQTSAAESPTAPHLPTTQEAPCAAPASSSSTQTAIAQGGAVNAAPLSIEFQQPSLF